MNFLWHTIRKLRRRRRLQAEMEAELAHHRELSRENGNPIHLGNVTAVKESVLDLWRFTFIENAWRDSVFAFRGLRRTPAYTVTAAGSLALGLGVCTALFTVLNAVALCPLSYAHPQQLVWITQVLKANNTDEVTFTADFLDWRAGNRAFQAWPESWRETARCLRLFATSLAASSPARRRRAPARI